MTTLIYLLQGCDESLIKSPSKEFASSQIESSTNSKGMTELNFDKIERYALLVSMSNYEGGNKLENPVNDVKAMKELLNSRKPMWSVEEIQNKSKREVEDKISDFINRHQEKILLFFYTGHATQVNGNSYLLPVGEKFNSLADVTYNAISADYILGKFADAHSKLSIIILDSCRDNNFVAMRGRGEKGMAPLNFSSSSVGDYYIVYATRPGETAIDKCGNNSCFTKHFLQIMNEYGTIPLESAMKKVVKRVSDETDGKQVPAVNTSARVDFCLFGCINKPEPPIDGTTPPDPTKTTEKNPVDETEPEPEKPKPLSSECKRLIAKVESIDGGILLPKEQKFFDSNCGRRS